MGTYRQPATIRDQAGLKQAADTFSTDNLVDEDLIMAATGEGECSPCKDGSVPGKDKSGKCIPCSQNTNSNKRANAMIKKAYHPNPSKCGKGLKWDVAKDTCVPI